MEEFVIEVPAEATRTEAARASECVAKMLRATFDPNAVPTVRAGIPMKEILFRDDVLAKIDEYHLPIILGKAEDDAVKIIDLADPNEDEFRANMLVCGSTGSGKSVFAESVVSCLMLKSSRRVQIIHWDYTGLAFGIVRFPGLTTYRGTTEIEKMLSSVVAEVDARLAKLKRKYVESIDEYNCADDGMELPYLLVIIDQFDFFELHDAKKFNAMTHILENAKATGVHVLALSQDWASNDAEKCLSKLFGRRLCLHCVLTWAYNTAFSRPKHFDDAVSRCGIGDGVYNDCEVPVLKLRTPNPEEIEQLARCKVALCY